MLSRLRMVRVAKLLVVMLAVGFAVVAYASHVRFEKLDPPVLLASQQVLKDRINCGADRLCVRGPYILETGEDGTLPEDLSRLVVRLNSGNVDLDLVIVFQYVEDGDSWEIRREDWVACISDSYGGQESCEFSSERELKGLRSKKIFIFVGNPSESGGHEFTLTAEWEPVRAPLCRNETCLPLISNQAVTKTIQQNSFRFQHEGKTARLFTVAVPPGALAMALRVRAGDPLSNVDAYLGRGRIAPEENPVEQASFALVSSLGEEMIILPRPTAGTYWLAVFNRTDQPQDVEITAAVLMDLQDLPSGASTSGQVATGTGLLPFLAQYLQTTQGTLAPTQYRLHLKEADLKGVTALQITLRGGGSPNLHVRFNKIVEIKDRRVLADLSAVGPATEKTISLSSALLKPGQIYVAVEGLGALPQNYELQAQLVKAGTTMLQTVRVVLEPVWVRLGEDN